MKKITTAFALSISAMYAQEQYQQHGVNKHY